MTGKARLHTTMVLACAASLCAQPERVYGLEARIENSVSRDKQVRTVYTFKPEHGELNDFIGDFDKVDAELTKKYGTPESDRAIWTDDSTQLEPKSYLDQDRATATGILPSDLYVGLAVSLGHLKMYTQWTTGHTKIVHTLRGGDGHIVHQLEYVEADSKPPDSHLSDKLQ